jgi:hypothetical protein
MCVCEQEGRQGCVSSSASCSSGYREGREQQQEEGDMVFEQQQAGLSCILASSSSGFEAGKRRCVPGSSVAVGWLLYPISGQRCSNLPPSECSSAQAVPQFAGSQASTTSTSRLPANTTASKAQRPHLLVHQDINGHPPPAGQLLGERQQVVAL